MKAIKITVKNKFSLEKRDLNVYHHSSRSAHMISHDSSVTLPLKPFMENDYLHISVVSGPGNLKYMSVVDLPSWADFECYSERAVIVTHLGDRTLVRIPGGTPPWQLRITQSSNSAVKGQSNWITIGDDLGKTL